MKIKQKNVIFLGQHDFSKSCLVSQRNICQPRKGWQSKRLASTKECQGIAFIPRFGILLSPVYSQLCSHGQIFTSVDWSNQCQKSKKVKKEVTTLENQKPDLTKQTFVWAPEHEKAFDTLKVALTTAPVVGYPNFSREFTLETDASLRGLGAVLSQVDDTIKVCVIAYASQTLRPS